MRVAATKLTPVLQTIERRVAEYIAMEEPEIALPPHTQRRITNYLIENTTQCLVTSHLPYVIEKFEPPRCGRSEDGEVTGKPVALGSMKAQTYRRYIRRGLAEAMLGRGVVVAEGLTEQLARAAVGHRRDPLIRVLIAPWLVADKLMHWTAAPGRRGVGSAPPEWQPRSAVIRRHCTTWRLGGRVIFPDGTSPSRKPRSL